MFRGTGFVTPPILPPPRPFPLSSPADGNAAAVPPRNTTTLLRVCVPTGRWRVYMLWEHRGPLQDKRSDPRYTCSRRTTIGENICCKQIIDYRWGNGQLFCNSCLEQVGSGIYFKSRFPKHPLPTPPNTESTIQQKQQQQKKCVFLFNYFHYHQGCFVFVMDAVMDAVMDGF